MKIIPNYFPLQCGPNSDNGPKATGYTMWLSATDTYNWAHCPGHYWPGSQTSDNRLLIVVDSNGLCDGSMNGKDFPDDLSGNELEALVADHLPADCRHLWPCWEPAAPTPTIPAPLTPAD